VLEMPAVLFEQVGDDVHAPNRFQHGLVLLDLFGHGPPAFEKYSSGAKNPATKAAKGRDG
jgi:hypothetical protein